jgi:hypothetical protein
LASYRVVAGYIDEFFMAVKIEYPALDPNFKSEITKLRPEVAADFLLVCLQRVA